MKQAVLSLAVMLALVDYVVRCKSTSIRKYPEDTDFHSWFHPRNQ